MKRILLILLCVLFTLSCLSACTDYTHDDEKLLIVVTAFPHYDFARQIAGDCENVEIRMLISPGREVHTYDPSVEDMVDINRCDIFIYTGGHSDVWVEGILESAENKNMTAISLMETCDNGSHEHEHEHSHPNDGHDHYDEHVWTSPVYAMEITRKICQIMCEKDPENAEKYSENRDNYLSKLSSLDAGFSDIMSNSKRHEIIVADRFPFLHLVTEYGIEYMAAYPGCASSTEPNALTVANLSEKVKNDDIPVVFTIEFSNREIAKNVTENTAAQILTLHSCHNVTADEFENGITYLDLMQNNLQNLRKALCE